MKDQPTRVDAGTLYVCGTPIGNLGDASQRLRETLAQVAWIAAEDTRQTRKLLAHFDIHAPLIAYHEHNRARQEPELIARLCRGESGALVTDAGMPVVSDPGQTLVDAAQRAGVPVRVVPGPSAVTAALALAGLPASRWCFEGFLPRQGRPRQERLAQLQHEPRTIVLYEAPHRLVQTLRDLVGTLGPRPAAVLRELTKRFEECQRGSLDQLLNRWEQQETIKGEFCIVIAPAQLGEPTAGQGESSPTPVLGRPDAESSLAPPDEQGRALYRQRVAQLQAEGSTRSQAVRQLAAELEITRSQLYDYLYGSEGSKSSPAPAEPKRGVQKTDYPGPARQR